MTIRSISIYSRLSILGPIPTLLHSTTKPVLHFRQFPARAISAMTCAFVPATPLRLFRQTAPHATSRATRPACTASPPKPATMPQTDIKRMEPGKRFNQIVIHDGKVYLSGQVMRGTNGSVYTQTVGILAKIDDLLAKAGTDKTRLLSVNIYLTNIAEAPEMNRAWDEWVSHDHMPTRATVQSALVDDEITVEIQAVAALPSPARTIATEEAAAAVGPYNQGVVIEDGTVFVSGCIGLLPKDGGMVAGGVKEQTVQALNNVRAILKEAGASPNDIVKTTILLDDIGDFGEVNKIYEAFFEGGSVPARSCFAAKQLPKAALVEIDAVATLSRT